MDAERLLEIEKQKYYQGFGVGEEKEMFKEELEALKTAYEDEIQHNSRKISSKLMYLVNVMEDFIDLYRDNEEIEEKLDILMEKMQRTPPA